MTVLDYLANAWLALHWAGLAFVVGLSPLWWPRVEPVVLRAVHWLMPARFWRWRQNAAWTTYALHRIEPYVGRHVADPNRFRFLPEWSSPGYGGATP